MLCSRRYDILNLLLIKMYVACVDLTDRLFQGVFWQEAFYVPPLFVTDKAVDFVSLIIEIELFHSVYIIKSSCFCSVTIVSFVQPSEVKTTVIFRQNVFVSLSWKCNRSYVMARRNALFLCVATLVIKVKPQLFFAKAKYGVNSQQAKFHLSRCSLCGLQSFVHSAW